MTDLPGPPEAESKYSVPVEVCPHPEYWSATDWHSPEIEVSAMVGGLVRGLQPDLVVETGTAWGQTAEQIGIALLANGHGRLVSLEVDSFRVGYARERCDGLPVEIVECPSLDWEPDGPVEFCWFDSLFPLRVAEFWAYRPFMRTGTVVVFHDTVAGAGGGQFPDGKDLRATIEDELSGVRLVHLPTPRGVTLGEVL